MIELNREETIEDLKVKLRESRPVVLGDNNREVRVCISIGGNHLLFEDMIDDKVVDYIVVEWNDGIKLIGDILDLSPADKYLSYNGREMN